MGIRLAPTEAWDVIAASHTGILTTLRRDGLPVLGTAPEGRMLTWGNARITLGKRS